MIGITKKVEVVPLQSEANANYNPFANDTTNATDIQAIKAAFLADTDVLAALKGDDGQQGQQGPQGNQGQTGPAGDSVIVRDTDPTDAVSSKVGDLYLNTMSGTLYQRSGITQAQFYAAGLQGLVLPNSIWIRKGNLKGATGDKGDRGDGIINGLGHPHTTIQTLPPVGTLYVNRNTFMMYERTANYFTPGQIQEGEIDYTMGYWYALGSLKGATGETGDKGDKGDGIINGLGHPHTTIQTLPPVGTLYINKNTFMVYERTADYFTPGQIQEGEIDYTMGYWYALGSLVGANGQSGTDGEDGLDGTVISVNANHLNVAAKDGDLCINTTNYNLYKWRVGVGNTSSVWQNLGNIKGATGDTGQDGASATKILSNYEVIGNYDLLESDMGKTFVVTAECGLVTMQEIDNYDGSIIVINDQYSNITILNANGTQSVVCSQKSVSVISFKSDGSVSVNNLKANKKMIKLVDTGETFSISDTDSDTYLDVTMDFLGSSIYIPEVMQQDSVLEISNQNNFAVNIRKTSDSTVFKTVPAFTTCKLVYCSYLGNNATKFWYGYKISSTVL